MQTAQNLLRPNQVVEISDEKRRLEVAINSPHVREKGEAVQVAPKLKP